MRRIFLPILIFAFTNNVIAQLQVTYFVQGDADDWQLFMSKKVIGDLSSGGKVITITLTAGDAGNGLSTFNGSPTPYYLARERGSVYSAKFVSDITNSPLYPNTYAIPVAQTAVINGKTLTKYIYGNSNGVGRVVSYFLRLPDGGQTGAGYPGTGNVSLKKLKDGVIPNITSVDGVNTYTWTDLVNTIYGILFTEKGADPQVWLNAASLDNTVNPNDYSDHIYSSTAAQEAVATRLWVGINEFVMDYSSNIASNLNNEEFEQACAAFGVYNWSLIKSKYANALNSTTRAWLTSETFAIKRSPVGNGPLPITLLSFTGSLKGNNALLEWTTSSEINSKEFILEKSNDAINYRQLARIPAAGNSSGNRLYSYLDVTATDINYYRLKMVDIDGANKLSDVVIVKNNGLTQAISALTNPFRDHISIRFAKLPKGDVSLKLVDLSGRLISSQKILNPVSSIIRFDYDAVLSKGIYILQAENQGIQYFIKLIKE